MLLKASSKGGWILIKLDCFFCPTRLAPWTGQTLGNAILPVTADLPVGSLWFTSRHYDSRTVQLQPVERLRIGATERGRFAGSWPMERQQDQSKDAEWLGDDAERWAICQEFLCDITVLCSEQSDQCGLWQRFSQHRLWEDLLHMHHADWRWAEPDARGVILCGNEKSTILFGFVKFEKLFRKTVLTCANEYVVLVTRPCSWGWREFHTFWRS